MKPSKAFILLKGLRETSRFKSKINGYKTTTDLIFQAMIIDRLSLLVYSKTKDAEKGINKPKMIMDSLIEKENKDDHLVFNSGKEFFEYRNKLLEGV